MDTISPKGALDRAIAKAGGQAKLAAALSITTQAISQWEMVPLNRVLAVSNATGMTVQELRPDFFGALDAQADQSAAPGAAA